MQSIGIYEAVGAAKRNVFFGCDDESLLKALYEDAAKVAGVELNKQDPSIGTTVKRVGEVAITTVKGDADEYKVASPMGKPETGRAPNASAGTWIVQSLVFSKENFTLEEAKKWIKEHKQFADVGSDDTTTSIKFRQYDPGYFEKFRTFDLDKGIRAVYGMIKTEKRDDADAEKDIVASIEDHDAVKALNEKILKSGVKLLADDTIEKSVEQEERFILGLVLEPNDGDSGAKLKPDTQGDIYSAKAIRDTAHGWMEKYGQVDLMHNWQAMGASDVAVLESYLAPVDFTMNKGKTAYKVTKGTWLLALRIGSDELWEAVKRGDIGAFSVGGKAQRTEV